MFVWERIFDQHCNPELPHAVVQLSSKLLIFHRLTPAIAHVCSVESLMLGLKPINPEGISGDITPYLPAAQSVHVKAPACEDLPTAQLVHNAYPVTDLYLPAVHEAHGFRSTPSWPAAQERMQGPEPIDPLDVPAGHAVHGPPSAPVN